MLTATQNDLLVILDAEGRRINKALGNGGRGGDAPIDNPASPLDHNKMENRVQKLEFFAQDTRERLARIETKMDSFATKTDVAEAKNTIIMWVVSAILLAQLLPSILKKFGI